MDPSGGRGDHAGSDHLEAVSLGPAGPAPGGVAVLVPARNEKEQIGATLQSLLEQTRRPDEIIVICNNCTDQGETYRIASTFGVKVLDMPRNEFKKAGALNAGLRYLLRSGHRPKFLVTIDADTILDKHFIERATRVMVSHPRLGGLSAVCRGKPSPIVWPTRSSVEVRRRHSHARPSSWAYLCALCQATAVVLVRSSLLWLQRAEYERAAATRLRYNIHTLSGAGSVLRAGAVIDVLRDRGQLYAERHDNLVEDYEVTLEVKRHGWECTNNFYCVAYTDLMVTLPDLLRQRMRWVRGSIDELRRRGWRPETRISMLSLAWGYAGMPLFYLWLYLFIRVVAAGQLRWQTSWIILGTCAYQAWTLRRMSLSSKLVGFLLVPEQLFNLVRHGWLLGSAATSYLSESHSWD